MHVPPMRFLVGISRVLFAALLSPLIAPAANLMQSLDGADWQLRVENPQTPTFSEKKNQAWFPASVPGNVQTDLEAANVVLPLNTTVSPPGYRDIEKEAWLYRKEFTPLDTMKGQRVTLVFDGVDSQSEVWLNGEKIGANPNMNRRFWFDVTDRLKFGQSNRLEVKIAGAPVHAQPQTWAAVKKDPENRQKQATQRLRALEALRDFKNPPVFGWDWAPSLWTLGIFKSVKLVATGPARIEWTKVETKLSPDFRQAQVTILLEINSTAAFSGAAEFHLTGQGADIKGRVPVKLTPGAQTVKTTLTVDQPALWWPNGQGGQPLYTVTSRLVDGHGAVSDSVDTRFGIREISWKLTETAPADFPEKYLLVINGREVRTMGSNLAPPDLFPSRSDQKFPHLLELVRAAGMNTLRLWAVGSSLPDSFYDQADELGILLEYELPIANMDPVFNETLLANLDVTIPNMIRQVWNHPSVIEYDGGSEMNYGRAGDWRVLEHIRRIFAATDSTRLFRDTDASASGARHGPYQVHGVEDHFKNYNNLLTHGRLLTDNQAKPGEDPDNIVMRRNEFGTSVPAHLETWQMIVPPNEQWPLDPDSEALFYKKGHHSRGLSEPMRWAWLFPEPVQRLFGPASLEEFIKGGQWLGGETVRYAADSYRLRGRKTAGMLTWAFNEPWSNIASSYVVDYHGRPLLNYAFLSQAYAPVAPSLRYDSPLVPPGAPLRADLWLTNDAPEPQRDSKWSWIARDRRGQVLGSGQGETTLGTIEAKKVTEISAPIPPEISAGPFLVELSVQDAHGQLLAERVYVFGSESVTSPLRGLIVNGGPDSPDNTPGIPPTWKPLARTTLAVTKQTHATDQNGETLQLDVQNTGSMTALFVDPRPTNNRTDFIVNDPFVCIPPGETRTIRLTLPKTAHPKPTLQQTAWRLESWNAAPVTLDPANSSG